MSFLVPVFKNVWERFTAKNYLPVSILFVGLLVTLRNVVFFSDFQYDFRSSHLTADVVTVVSNRTAMAFNRSGATQALALDT